MTPRLPFIASALLGASGVGLGAFGAHALRGRLIEFGNLETWQTAVHYHLLHAVALLALAALAAAQPRRLACWIAGFWLTGTVLFSGSLYWFSLSGPRFVVFVTPLGGVCFLIGWLLLLFWNPRAQPASPGA